MFGGGIHLASTRSERFSEQPYRERCRIIRYRILYMEEEARRKCIHEVKNLIHRWSEESDLDDAQIVECMVTASEEYFEEDVIEFYIDMNLD